MCGLVVVVDYTKALNTESLINMVDSLAHRGPNFSSAQILKNDSAYIGLGHRRLSILDLSKTGNQPMLSPDGNLTIVYNGEVYNFLELKKQLIEKGYTFTSNSDTEVILNAYHCWGKRCVQKFNGMFAIIIYDKEKNKLFVCRDRAGIKPLFFYQTSQVMMFASELKAFHHSPLFNKEINFNSVALYLKYSYIPTPHTIFNNCEKIKPGTLLEIDCSRKKVHREPYWDLYDYYKQEKLQVSEEEAMAEVEKLIYSSCHYRMIADVPVGLFLSSGYDSTALTAILQKHYASRLKTFTIGFEDPKLDESKLSKKIAAHLGTDHTDYICKEEELLDLFPKLSHYYDEPFGDSSAIPTMLVSSLAKGSVDVVLSADGGDELFGGYDRYFQNISMWEKVYHYRSILKFIVPVLQPFENRLRPGSTKFQTIGKIISKDSIDKVVKMKSAPPYFSDQLLEDVLINSYNHDTPFFSESTSVLNDQNSFTEKMMALEFKTYLLDDILQKVDRATMSASLEGRVPFLDHHLIEFVAKIPSHIKYKNNISKALLKNIVHQYVPTSLLTKEKKGFSIPMKTWLQGPLKETVRHYLSESSIKNQDIFNHNCVNKLREEFFNKGLHTENIWSLLIFSQWKESWNR